jgi:hypothetical protein
MKVNKMKPSEVPAFKDWVKSYLKTDVLIVTFTKKDGTPREMHCTLLETTVPPTPPLEEGVEVKERVLSDDVLRVWDVQSDGWRSFRWDSVTEIKFIP